MVSECFVCLRDPGVFCPSQSGNLAKENQARMFLEEQKVKGDEYTPVHQSRVACLACAIALRLGFPQEKADVVYLSGLVHDIGKIGLPQDKKTDLMDTHSWRGYLALKGFDGQVASIVLQHHERIDGSGYPWGLWAGDILLEAKILAVADVVDAMIADRPYRGALDIKTVIKEIENGSGSHYDPGIVTACIDILQGRTRVKGL